MRIELILLILYFNTFIAVFNIPYNPVIFGSISISGICGLMLGRKVWHLEDELK